MATVALVWELGADYGHVARYLSIGMALRERGHRPIMLLRDISRAHELLGVHGFEYFQAPLWLAPVKGLPQALSFAETLFLFGFLHHDGLLSMATAWRQLLAVIQVDLMIFDHAPSALLATRGLGFPRLVTGNSFAVPPSISPWPAYRWWEKQANENRLADSEARVVACANYVLEKLQAPPIKVAADLYDVDATQILASPELDAYGKRADDLYIGSINALDHGVSPRWPRGGQLKIFAYLKPSYSLFEAALSTLSRFDASIIVFAPGASVVHRRRYESANLCFSAQPLRMSEVREQCDIGVCHAGGVIDVMLEAGKPLILLPTQLEQVMISRRVEQLGCGLWVDSDQGGVALARVFKQVVSKPEFAQSAQAYAVRNKRFSQGQSLASLIERCEGLLHSGKVQKV